MLPATSPPPTRPPPSLGRPSALRRHSFPRTRHLKVGASPALRLHALGGGDAVHFPRGQPPDSDCQVASASHHDVDAPPRICQAQTVTPPAGAGQPSP